MKLKNSLPLVTLLCGLLLASTWAQAVTCRYNVPPSNPDSIYIDHGNGTVTDQRTGLMWTKCQVGRSGDNCEAGTATKTTWANAFALADSSGFAGYSDWRLPSAKELQSLVEECRSNPAINNVVFPGPIVGDLWSGSPSAADTGDAWVVRVGNGMLFSTTRSDSGVALRLVRGGQMLGPLVEDGICGTANGVATLAAPSGVALCSAGTEGAVSSAGGQHSWQCAGRNGGTTAQCQAPGMPAVGGGSGSVALTLTGGAGCTVESASLIEPPAGGPTGVSMPYGALDFAVTGCTGGSVTVQASFSGSVDGMRYWKYINGGWVRMPATLAGNTVSFTIEDDGPFDADPTPGRIVDPSGPGMSAAAVGVTAVPTLSQWATLMLAGLMGVLAFGRWRRG